MFIFTQIRKQQYSQDLFKNVAEGYNNSCVSLWNDANFNQMLKILIKALHEGSEACGLASRHKSFR